MYFQLTVNDAAGKYVVCVLLLKMAAIGDMQTQWVLPQYLVNVPEQMLMPKKGL